MQGHIGAAIGETMVFRGIRHEPILGQNASELPIDLFTVFTNRVFVTLANFLDHDCT